MGSRTFDFSFGSMLPNDGPRFHPDRTPIEGTNVLCCLSLVRVTIINMDVLDGVAAHDVNPNQQRLVVPDGSKNYNSAKCLFPFDYAPVFLLLFSRDKQTRLPTRKMKLFWLV